MFALKSLNIWYPLAVGRRGHEDLTVNGIYPDLNSVILQLTAKYDNRRVRWFFVFFQDI